MLLTLVVPELIWPQSDGAEASGLELPALCRLLARGCRSRRPKASPEAALCALFGQAPTVSYAALRAAGEADPLPAAAARICCDPVHLRFHQDHLLLADSANFGITLAEAQALVATLNTELGDSGAFELASAERWYLRPADSETAACLETPPLSSVAGRSVERLLADGSAARPLRALLNEAQMLLHAHPVNEARERGGQWPINGLWFWGAGSAPARGASDFDGLWSNSALARGLAHEAGVPAHALVDHAGVLIDHAGVLIDHAAAHAHHLVVLEELLAPVHDENADACRQALIDLERRWFAPLRAALAQNRVERLRVVAPTAYGVLDWEMRPTDRWKLWRRPQSIAALAAELART